jgi:hypothetical protein
MKVSKGALQLKPSSISRGHQLYGRGAQYFCLLSNYSFFYNTDTRSKLSSRRMESNFRAESRFLFYHNCFCLGGIPLFNTSLSKFYHMFALFCYVCAYSTILAMFMNIYYRIEDLDEVVDIVMFFIVVSSQSCAQFYFR